MSENEIDLDISLKTTRDQASLVPHYALYGDLQDRPDWFINVEPLDKRCRERGWVIKPHTHPRMVQIAYCTHGGGRITIEGDAIAFSPGSIMVVPPHRIHGFVYESSAQGWVLTIQSLYLDELLRRAPELGRVVQSPVVLSFPDEVTKDAGAMLVAMHEELSGARKGRMIGVEIQLMSLLLLLLRHWPQDSREEPVAGSRADLVQRYRRLLESDFLAQPSQAELAGKLGVSTAQLRLACKEVTGMSPIELLHDRMVVEAKRCLSYTPMSIAEIADALGFSDTAYFSRFFSRLAGTAPSAFRKTNSTGN